jgi:hypothetical protein
MTFPMTYPSIVYPLKDTMNDDMMEIYFQIIKTISGKITG